MKILSKLFLTVIFGILTTGVLFAQNQVDGITGTDKEQRSNGHF